MSTVIMPGFTGYALCGANKLRFNTCSLNATQELEAPDMVMGDYTHDAWAYGKIEVGGQISGPLTENSINFIDEVWTTQGSTIDIKYYAGYARRFTNIWANTLTLNVTAGEVANFTLDLLGNTVAQTEPTMDWYTDTEKLLTWDKCAMYYGAAQATTFSGGNILPNLQSFSITIGNNITRQFIIKASDLFGELVRGISSVTGSLVAYNLKSGTNFGDKFTGSGALFWDQYANNDYHPIWFSIGDKNVQCTVVFHRATSELSVGPVLSTVGFTGIGHWGGENPAPPAHHIFA